MGLFDKLRSAFSKKPDPASLITAYDEYGRQVQIPREEWQRTVLPSWLQQHWIDPDALYSTIVTALNDGFYQEIVEASKQLLAIDPNQERSHTIRGIILMKIGDLDGAEQILQTYVQRFGPTGTILTNLAKVYAERGKHDQAETTLWEGLTLDPNQENGLDWWAAIQQERDAENGFLDAMRKVATIQGSWRPQLWLARECLEKKNIAEAMRYYDQVFRTSPDKSAVLVFMSGDLGNNGRFAELLDIVPPLYDPEKHDYRIGHNILQTYLATGNYAEGAEFVHRLSSLNRPDWKDDLAFYAAEFDRLKGTARQKPPLCEDYVEASAVHIDRPIWLYGLKDPAKWLLRSQERLGKPVVFLALANTSHTHLKEIIEQREDDLGRLTRSIPLYLMESAFFWTDAKPSVLIPMLAGKGPIVTGRDWPPEFIQKFARGIADIAVVGSVEQSGDRLTLRLSVWDCRENKAVTTIKQVGTRQTLGPMVLEAERQILEYLDPSSAKSSSPKSPFSPREPFYLRPPVEVLDHYLVCLGQSLMRTLARSEAIPADAIWGDRNMFECALALALEMPAAQVPRILFLSSLAESRACGASIYTEFRKQALKLLDDEKNTKSEFWRMSPLLFETFDMQKEFVLRRTNLLETPDPPYRQWLKDLGK